MIRVLVVDDSATMRALVSAALRRDPGIAVAGEAASAAEAREAIKALDPDVVTLDVEMPRMSGLDFLEKIMRLRPTPVVMVSSLTSRGAETTLAALELGAFDCVAKPSVAGPHAFDSLPAVVRAAAGSRVRGRPGPDASAPPAPPDPGRHAGYAPADRLVAVGASTGGVEALLTVLARLPADCPPVLVVQHMPAAFTPSFAARLDRACAADVREAGDGALLAPGRVFLAPGGAAHLEASSDGRRCRLVQGDPVSGHRPSADVLFASVARAAGPRGVGVILTGMGRDGARGLLAMRQAGARTLGQDEASCVVYGMPKAAMEAGAVERQVPLEAVAARLVELTDARRTHGKEPR